MSIQIFEQLKTEALYAQRSFSRELLYQDRAMTPSRGHARLNPARPLDGAASGICTYGKAQMARQLEALTKEEFMELNDMTVRFMNCDRAYIRHQNEEFRQLCRGGSGVRA